MSKCIKCGNLFVNNPPNDEMCHICRISDLEVKLAESEERLKIIDNWKKNYGYTNYEDIYMLEDLQSRAFQSEDDTKVVNELLDYLNISDESEILSTFKQQLAEKEKEIESLKRDNNLYKNNHFFRFYLGEDKVQDFCVSQEIIDMFTKHKIEFAIEKLRKAKFDALMLGGVVQGETFFINSKHFRNYIDNQINELKNKQRR